MALDHQTPQQPLTPETRRVMLCAFADRMLVKVTSMDDPEDLPGVERAVRVAAVIERLYSRCDRAQAQVPDPNKLEAERARNAAEAIQARNDLAKQLEWGDMRRQHLGKWWDAAGPEGPTQTLPQTPDPAPAPPLPPVSQVTRSQMRALLLGTSAQTQAQTQARTPAPANPLQPATVQPAPEPKPPAVPAQATIATSAAPEVQHVDYTDAILKARADMGLNDAGELPAPSRESETPAAAPSASGQPSGQTGPNPPTERPEDSGPRIRSLDSRWPP